MTLEEYRKKQAETRKETELQRRAAGEGVDDSQWKNTVLLAKNEEEVDVCAFFSCTFCGGVVALLRLPSGFNCGDSVIIKR